MAGEEMHCGKLEGTGRGQGMEEDYVLWLVRRCIAASLKALEEDKV